MSTNDSADSPFRRATPFDEENPFQDNPYASPDLHSAGGHTEPMPPSRGSMVRHVQTVAILMVVQGALELIMALFLIGLAVVMPLLFQSAQQGGPPGGRPPGAPPPELMSWIMFGMYGFTGFMVLVGAVLHIVAGVRNYKFRGRVLGIVALITGIVTTLLTCYCAPTAIALGVFGLICYLNPEVTDAFALVSAGKTKEEILQTMG
jgi:hypothetical protein